MLIPELEPQIAVLAQAYGRANGPLMRLVNKLGGGVEAQMALLPAALRDRIERVVEQALTVAHGMAAAGGAAPDLGPRGSTGFAILTGAAGGLAGLPGAVAELPLTITVILHAIRREAVAAGYDPARPEVRAACLQVFAAGAPLAEDDGLNTAFLSARLTLTGPALQRLIATVAPRLAAAMGQKLVAQAVPVLGALSGAALNAAYITYFRDMARIRFALLRLAETHGPEPVLTAFRTATEAPKLRHA